MYSHFVSVTFVSSLSCKNVSPCELEIYQVIFPHRLHLHPDRAGGPQVSDFWGRLPEIFEAFCLETGLSSSQRCSQTSAICNRTFPLDKHSRNSYSNLSKKSMLPTRQSLSGYLTHSPVLCVLWSFFSA